MAHVITIIAPLFLIILASALLQRYAGIREEWSVILNEYALKVGLPVLIFTSLAKSSISLSSGGGLVFANSLFILFCFLLAYLAGKMLVLSKKMYRTFFICFAFFNTAYMGLPVVTQALGQEAVPAASLIVAIYLFWLFTVGTGYLDYTGLKNKRLVLVNMGRNLIRNPLLISVVVGLIVGSLQIPLPLVLLKSLDMITASVTPTVLIVIGLFVGKSEIGKLRDWMPVFLFSLVTLLVLPAIFYFGVRILGFEPERFSTSILQAAMPLAITPFALADQYRLDRDFIARSIVLSTLLAVFTLPFWLMVL